MARPSGQDSCRKCGGRLSPGFVRGDAGSYGATITWTSDPPGPPPVEAFPGGDLARRPLTRFGDSPQFPALLCRTCKLIEFEYK